MVLDRHKKARATAKTAHDLEIPIVVLPARSHRDTLPSQLHFNAHQSLFGSLPLFGPDRPLPLQRHNEVARNTASPRLKAMGQTTTKSRRRLKQVQERRQSPEPELVA